MKKKTTGFDTAAEYDGAGGGDGSGGSGGGSFSDAYDQAGAPAAEGQEPQQDADQEGSETDLDIPAADVTKMQALKDKGDMAGLGTYVSQFLN